MSAEQLTAKILRRERSEDEYAVYRAALEWDLTDPIVLESDEDLRSTPRWQDRLTPYSHQVTNLITFCRRLPVTLLADDVGLGKTISAGLIVSELMARGRVSKLLVVCPKSIGPQWVTELLDKFNIQAEVATGRDLIQADPETGAVVTTYNSARLYLDDIPEDRFQMLILDEAHKLRNLYGTQTPPATAKRFQSALEERRFRFVLMLTATPIQNRLWDLYSLVDLLSVARGHENPFGNERMFARKFIADSKEKARQLNPEAKDEFRSIVYSYMSRIRRGDANLYFPERYVQLHRVQPTSGELALIKAIAAPIQKLNRLSQIGILQALTSSPEALMAQLRNMARNGTVPADLAATVTDIVKAMPPSAKLRGLEQLVDQLRRENPEKWRVVVFTTRRETQTTIEAFLQAKGIKVGIINGESAEQNQETIKSFRKDPPGVRVVVSTEAGAEGLNLQVANVVVNYDLPWNPMIVEQRIGRVQRLGSLHANVTIFNITLQDTFEEYIVGRLMEKLQMAAHAIGDIEALLKGSDVDDDEDDTGETFADRVLKLVLAALAGKDVKKQTDLEATSIEDAKRRLAEEQENIETMLGEADGRGYIGPRTPTLPPIVRSIPAPAFALAALKTLGAKVADAPPDLHLVERNGGREYIRFAEHPSSNLRSTYYGESSPAFQRLVGSMIATGIHRVNDLDRDASSESKELVKAWIQDMGARVKSLDVASAGRAFDGSALIRVRAGVAHDAYERLLDIPCSSTTHLARGEPSAIRPLSPTIERPLDIGLNETELVEAAARDDAIVEFRRFYLERREREVLAAGDDERKRKKLDDEFTPKVQTSLVGLEGDVHREVQIRATYRFDDESGYETVVTVIPCISRIIDPPETGLCTLSARTVPITCLDTCELTGASALRHLLARSEFSGRYAVPEFAIRCNATGKVALSDEVELSDITGKPVAISVAKKSAVSGRRGEPDYFSLCRFTKADVLKEELATSEISGKPYRNDQSMRSAVSELEGHRSEFVECAETRVPIARREAEQCEVTGSLVRPGILTTCQVTGKRVLPSETAVCSVSGRRVLKSLLVPSSVSGNLLLESVAVRAERNNYCAPNEAMACFWSGRKAHPDDIRKCRLTGLPVHVEFVTNDGPPRLRPMMEMLAGHRRTADSQSDWPEIAASISRASDGAKARIEAAVTSPDGNHLAVCAETRQLLGLKTRQVGAVYSFIDRSIVGKMPRGRREDSGWLPRS